MKIILGFGKTEKEQREQFKQKIEEIILKNHKIRKLKIDGNEYKEDTFSKQEIEKIRREIEELALQLRKQDERFSKNHYKDAPERYFYCWTTVVADCCNIFVGVDFSHINTRHPLSPDGLALLSMREAYWFDYDYINKKLKEIK